MGFDFFINSLLLGVGLSMDAFCVSIANGMNEPKMKIGKIGLIGGLFALFQGVMPMLGWLLVHTLLSYFQILEHFIPWIALILLCFIGGKMIYQGIKNKEDSEPIKTGILALLIQGVATSIDALSVGLTIATYELNAALIAAGIIATTTLIICIIGVVIGKKFGTVLNNKATIFGGAILVIIGLEICIKGLIGLYA